MEVGDGGGGEGLIWAAAAPHRVIVFPPLHGEPLLPSLDMHDAQGGQRVAALGACDGRAARRRGGAAGAHQQVAAEAAMRKAEHPALRPRLASRGGRQLLRPLLGVPDRAFGRRVSPTGDRCTPFTVRGREISHGKCGRQLPPRSALTQSRVGSASRAESHEPRHTPAPRGAMPSGGRCCAQRVGKGAASTGKK